jgi:carbonic anhydrase
VRESNRLLLQNKSWASEQLQSDPGYFERMSVTQKPRFLWIGCADSRVPAETVTGARPGEIFVHRNIANQVIATDMNMLSVLSYAVEHLKVEHIIVCGHYGCGGVRAAASNKDLGFLNKWLTHIKDSYASVYDELMSLPPDKREQKMIEAVAMAQVDNLLKTEPVQKARRSRQGPKLHAWVYSLEDGLLNELRSLGPDVEPHAAYRFDSFEADNSG